MDYLKKSQAESLLIILESEFAKDYAGTDDDMADRCNDWISGLTDEEVADICIKVFQEGI